MTKQRWCGARYDWAVVFPSELAFAIVHRDGIVYDTRFVPPSPREAQPNACVYLVLDGTFEVYEPSPHVVTGPACLVLTEEQLEGASGTRAFTYRVSGDPLTCLQLFFPAVHVRAPADFSGRLQLTERVWSAARTASQAAEDGNERELVRTTSVLLGELAREGIIAPAAADPRYLESPRALVAMWPGVERAIRGFELLPAMKVLGALAGVSERRAYRYVDELFSGVGYLASGWRAAIRQLRLKTAVAFLSAEGATVADVANRVGYGSVDAMMRAFRDASLPPPGDVKRALRGGLREG